jgi:hypothetical protein
MPITYKIDTESSSIRTDCVGDVTLAEVLDHFRVLEADPALPDRLDVLLDLSKMTLLPNSNDLRSAAERIGQLRSKVSWGVCAIVANSDALFGMIRMFEVYAEDFFAATRVFRKLPDAEAWFWSARTVDE